MSHYTVLVVGSGVAKQLEPYWEGLQCPERTVYLDQPEIDRMAEVYKTTDHTTLANRMEDWSGVKGGVDEKGIYRITTYNEKAKWDWYEVGGRWDGFFLLKNGRHANRAAKKLVDVKKMGDFTTFAVLVNGVWFEKGKMGWFATVAGANPQWPAKFRELWDAIPDDAVVTLVDCHI